MDEQRTRAIVRLQASLRNSNHRVAESQEGKDVLTGLFCECGYVDCHRKLRIGAADYNRIRSHRRWFLVASGHDIAGAEVVVEDHAEWVVVEKPEEAGSALERVDDPESPSQ